MDLFVSKRTFFNTIGFSSAYKITGIVITLIILLGCYQTKLTNEEKEAISIEITNVLNKYTLAISHDGLMAEFDFLDSSAEFYWIPPGYTSALKYDSVKAIISGIAPGIKSMDNKYHDIQIWPYSNTHVGYTAHVNSTGVDTAGNTNITTLLESGTLIKRRNGWKLLSGHTSVVK